MDFAKGLGRRAVPDRPCLLKEKNYTLYSQETEYRDLKKPGIADGGQGKCGVKKQRKNEIKAGSGKEKTGKGKDRTKDRSGKRMPEGKTGEKENGRESGMADRKRHEIAGRGKEAERLRRKI